MKIPLVLLIMMILMMPIIAVAQTEERLPGSSAVTAMTSVNVPEGEQIDTGEAIESRERRAWMEIGALRNCKVDADCISTICPMVIGRDTPMCVEGVCICGPGRTPKYPINESKIQACMKIRERIKKIVELMKEKENVTNREVLIKELSRLKEENKDCFPQPQPVVVPIIAIESKIKKAEALDEFLVEMRNLKEETINIITSQNLTGKELAEVVKEYNEKRRELVREFVEKIHEINMERMEEIKEVVVARKVKWEDVTLANVTKVTITVNDKNITIEPGDTVKINVEGIVVKSTIPLRVRNNILEDAETNQTIKETPERVRAKIREENS